MAMTRNKKQPPVEDDQPPVDLTDAYSPHDVARMLRVKISTLANWRNKGLPNKPPYVALSRKVILYPRAQFLQWATRQKLKGMD